jgi:cellulose synthase/poly-beta-1,6-N-acetylglucosamine synthase-like glycosyltransferase
MTPFLLTAYLSVLLVIFLYQAVLALWGIRSPRAGSRSFDYRFAVIIPAHNEESVIGDLIDSFRGLRYPRENLYPVFVLDHCTDGTLRIVADSEFPFIQRNTGRRGKVPSMIEGLDWVRTHLENQIDAIAFFDADNIVHPEFFGYVAGRLQSGAPIIQGQVTIQNRNATVFARLSHISMSALARLKELARSRAGLSCLLRGHGMVFRRDVLEKIRWESTSLVEDREMLVRLVLANYRVTWEHSAIVESVFPATLRAAAPQRKRWAGGKSAITWQSVKALYRKWRSDHDWVAFDLMVDFLMPSHAVQVSLVFLGVLVSLLITGPYSFPTLLAISILGIYFLYFSLAGILGGIRIRNLLDVAVAPIYILWRTWIFLASMKGVARWR